MVLRKLLVCLCHCNVSMLWKTTTSKHLKDKLILQHNAQLKMVISQTWTQEKNCSSKEIFFLFQGAAKKQKNLKVVWQWNLFVDVGCEIKSPKRNFSFSGHLFDFTRFWIRFTLKPEFIRGKKQNKTNQNLNQRTKKNPKKTQI